MHSQLTRRSANRPGSEEFFANPCRVSVLLSLLLLPVSPFVLAQSDDTGDSANAVAEELQKNLENERKELENVLQERETMLAEQAGVRDELAEQEKELEEKMKALMELCEQHNACLLYTSPSPRDATLSRMPSSA